MIFDDDRSENLNDVLADAAADTEWALQGELRRAEPDFGEAIRRARELDPDAVSEQQVAAAGRVRVEPRPTAADRVDAHAADSLRASIAALQAEADADVEARQLEAIPSFSPPPGPVPRANRWVTVGVAAAAAAVVLGWGLPRVIDATNGGQAHTASQAELDQSALDGAVQTTRPRPAPSLQEIAPAPSPAPITARVHEDVTPSVDESSPRPEPRRAPHREPAAPAPISDPLADLDARAQELWRAGDLPGAERLFREIITRAPASRHAELAYGDLFTLVRQRKQAANLEQLRRDYLASYPRGRFADDARAELCARGGDPDCWAAYLDDFPEGAHIERARATREETP